jgi:hypothetical protein
MTEPKKQRMDPARFIEIFKRYSFEEKGEILKSLKDDYVIHGHAIRSQLEAQLQDIENKIS